MKIALVNYHYFINGGPDRYFFNIKRALEAQGHSIVPFCFDYDETLDTPYRAYFPAPITGRGPCMYEKQSLSAKGKIGALAKMFYNAEADRKFHAFLEKEQPDLVYMIYLSSTFLPNLIKIAKKRFGIPVVYRLSDFHLYCPTYLFCRDGEVCTECVESPWACVRNRCVKNSRLLSFAKTLQVQYFRMRDYYRWIDAFVCPTAFMASFLAEHGFEGRRIVHLPTFAEDVGCQTAGSHSSEKRILFLANVTREKGIEVLLKAYAQADMKLPLDIVGKYEQAYINTLSKSVPEPIRRKVRFRGFLSGDALYESMRSAQFLVHPVLWYENMPNSVVEMLSLGKPIAASRIGSMPELVRHEENGLLTEPGDATGLADCMKRLETEPETVRTFGQASRDLYENRHTEEHHTARLIDLFETCLN